MEHQPVPHRPLLNEATPPGGEAQILYRYTLLELKYAGLNVARLATSAPFWQDKIVIRRLPDHASPCPDPRAGHDMDTLVQDDDLILGPFLTDLIALGQSRNLERGATLFHQDDPGDYVYILTEGLIEVSVTSLNGRKSILAHCGPGEVLGEISVLDGKTRSADAVALKDCKGTVVWRRDLYAMLAKNPETTMTLIEALCGRIRNASDRFAVNALTSAPARLASCILRLCDKWGEETETGIRISEPLSQTELGAFAGLARENVNRHINRWSKDGILTFDNCVIEVLDMDQLEELAEA